MSSIPCCAALPREVLMTLRGRAGFAFLLVLAFAMAPSIPSLAAGTEPGPPVGEQAAPGPDAGESPGAHHALATRIGVPFLDLVDPDGTIGRSLDPELAGGLLASLRRGVVRSEDPERTALDAARLASDLLRGPLAAASPGSEESLALKRLALAAAIETTAELHPELRDTLADAWRQSRGPSPVEVLCECIRSGSSACGCQVRETGPGACEFGVNCQTHWGATCFGINIDGCIAKVIMTIIRATPDSAVP